MQGVGQSDRPQLPQANCQIWMLELHPTRNMECTLTAVNLKREITIKLRDQDIHLKEGEMFVVPKGVEYCPVAENEAEVLLIEPHNTPNTGDPNTAEKKVVI